MRGYVCPSENKGSCFWVLVTRQLCDFGQVAFLFWAAIHICKMKRTICFSPPASQACSRYLYPVLIGGSWQCCNAASHWSWITSHVSMWLTGSAAWTFLSSSYSRPQPCTASLPRGQHTAEFWVWGPIELLETDKAPEHQEVGRSLGPS